jgi:hypothetical protein
MGKSENSGGETGRVSRIQFLDLLWDTRLQVGHHEDYSFYGSVTNHCCHSWVHQDRRQVYDRQENCLVERVVARVARKQASKSVSDA